MLHVALLQHTQREPNILTCGRNSIEECWPSEPKVVGASPTGRWSLFLPGPRGLPSRSFCPAALVNGFREPRAVHCGAAPRVCRVRRERAVVATLDIPAARLAAPPCFISSRAASLLLRAAACADDDSRSWCAALGPVLRCPPGLALLLESWRSPSGCRGIRRRRRRRRDPVPPRVKGSQSPC